MFVLALFTFFVCYLPTYAKEKWKEERSTHFIVYFKEAPLDFIDEVIEEAEDYYVTITRNLGFVRFDFWLWDKRAKFYIYNDREDYLKFTNQPGWSGGAAHYREKTVITYPQMAGFFDSLMPHELGHIIFREFIGNRTGIPLWLEEGVACYQEKSKRFGADKIVKKAQAENKFIPLEVLSTMNIQTVKDKKLVELFYAEATSIVNFMISKFGRVRFGWFCRDLKDGKSFESSLWRFHCRDIAALNKAWVKYLKEQ